MEDAQIIAMFADERTREDAFSHLLKKIPTENILARQTHGHQS